MLPARGRAGFLRERVRVIWSMPPILARPPPRAREYRYSAPVPPVPSSAPPHRSGGTVSSGLSGKELHGGERADLTRGGGAPGGRRGGRGRVGRGGMDDAGPPDRLGRRDH